MPFALYWDESDPGNSMTSKIRRSLYIDLESAKNQAMHDLLCMRCRVFDGIRPTLESTGLEPLNPYLEQLGLKAPCQVCKGSKLDPSRNILYIEEISESALNEFNALAKGHSDRGIPAPEFIHGDKVWQPGE